VHQYYTSILKIRISYDIFYFKFFIGIPNSIKDIKKTQFTEKTNNILRTYKFFKNDILQPNNNYVGPIGALNCLFEKVYLFQAILN